MTIYLPKNGNITYDNWSGGIYISVGASSATFAITPGAAGGGYSTYPLSPVHNTRLGTGSANLPSSSSNNIVLTGSKNPDKTYTPVNNITNTNGSNTGLTKYSTTDGDPVNLVSGNFYLPETDFHLKGAGGLDMVFKRHYNSNMRKDGPLGFGWTHSFNHRLHFFDKNIHNKKTKKQKKKIRTNQVVWVDGSGDTRYFAVNGSKQGIAKNTLFTNPDGVYVTAQRDRTGEYRISEKNGLSFYFEAIKGTHNTQAKLLRVVDRNNNTIHLTYDANGNLESVRDDLYHTIDFFYDNNDSHITHIDDWSGHSWHYTYADNNLVKYETTLAITGKEHPTTYEYYTAADGANLDHALLRYTRPTGKSMTFEYYTNAKVFRHTDDLDNHYTFRYNAFRRETTTIDERGIKQRYLFNEYGQQLSHIQGDGAQLSYEYSDRSQPLNETLRRHALGYETQYQYDNNGNLIRTTLPDNSTLQSIGLNAYNSPCTRRDNNGHYTLNRYDSKGNLTELIKLKKDTTLTPTDESSCSYTPPVNTLLSWQINTYNSKGQLLTRKQVKDFATQTGPYAEYVYDPQFNPVTVKRCGQQQDHTGQLTQRCVSGTQRFDSLGRAVTLLDGDFYSTQMQYDANGRLLRSTDALNQWHDLTYDKQGRLIGESLMGPRADGQIDFLLNNTINYDVMDRPITTQNLIGDTTRTEYDETGNITRLTNPDGYAVRFEYDQQNRPVKAFDEQGHAVSTQYDIGGRPVKTTDPNGNSTLYEYYGASENGRLQTIIQNNTDSTQRTLTYFYDNNGNVIRTRDNLGRENLTDYDALSRPIRTVGPLFDGHGLSNIRQVTQTTYNTLG
ncbi:MAG: hypothetical protein KZQ74_02415, partial [gamma proteobacterium symbiont of Bathyaustriella thionipta]|nr:hypothetical protein [gamma proteobacterium symbiont of Bathyaustriella thionipta]